jgi:hypothetical protein
MVCIPMPDWFIQYFTGPYSESRIAALITPFVIAIYMLLRAGKGEDPPDRGGE